MSYSSVIRRANNENVAAESSAAAAAAAFLRPLLPPLCAGNRDHLAEAGVKSYNRRIGAFIDCHGLQYVLRGGYLGSYGAVL